MMLDEVKLGTVLVIGGGGFLGSHIINRLLDGQLADTIITASRNKGLEETAKGSRIKYHAVDITSSSSVQALFEKFKPQVVLHTASPPPRSHRSILDATNITGTQNLLEAARACPETRAFVYTSSDSACHPSPVHQITEEQCTLYTADDFPNHYARTKAVADAAVLAANSPGLSTATMRLPSIYGESDTNFIRQIVESIRNEQWKNQIGLDEKIFEFTYVKSAAEAHILAAHALLSRRPGTDGQAYFITDGVSMPFFDFMRKCYAAAGCTARKEEVKIVPFWLVRSLASSGEWLLWLVTLGKVAPKLRRDDIDHLDTGCHWSIEKARSLLGYEPIADMNEAVNRSMKWGLEKY